MSAPDNETLRRLASGEAPLSDEATHAAWCAAEVLRLRGLHEDALAMHERLAIRAWDAVTGDHHEPPASEDALVEGIERLRAELDASRETARALGASLAATRADYHAMEEAYYATQAEVLRLRGLISERCAAVETGPMRRRIPGCQTVGPCHVCDYPQTATAPGRELGGGGGETDGGDVQTQRE